MPRRGADRRWLDYMRCAYSLLSPARPPGQTLPPAADTKANVNAITVESRRETLQRQVSEFVTSITVQTPDASLARWRIAICPLVSGLPPVQGDFIVSRLSEVAKSSSAPDVVPQKCSTNFYVVVTPQPDALLKKWRVRDPKLFGDTGQAKINTFLNSTRPIRVWYNADMDTADGKALTGGGPSVLTNTRAKLSRLEWDEIKDLTSVIVVVDTSRLKDINAGQLADYVVMVGLAEIHLEADVGLAPTILRLFAAKDDAPKPQELTNWDESFLKSLYVTPQKDRSQLLQIKTNMTDFIAQ
jgi:hypothetical protein